MRTLTLALLGGVLLTAGACQSQVPRQLPALVGQDSAILAGAAMEAGRYAEAVALFGQALEGAPASASLRYGLAVALSYTDRGAATREFQWVLANAHPDSQEASQSRDWLARAGALPRTAVALATAAEHEQQRANSALGGSAVFGETGRRPQPMPRLQLFLVGQPDSPTKEERYNLRTDEDGNFKFPNVVPGPYMLTNRIAGQPIWRLRIELKAAEEKHLALGPENSISARDDFPQPR
jgi:hypothetical protein